MRKLLVLVLLALVSGIAFAGSGTTTHDTLVLTVTPSYSLSVNISTATYAFGNIALTSTKTVVIGDIQNDGNVASKWQKMSADSAGIGGDLWTLVQAYPGQNQFRLLVLSSGTGTSAGVTTGATTTLPGNNVNYEATASMTDLVSRSNSAVADTIGIDETRTLWVSLHMPTSINATGDSAQTITLTVLAVLP